MLMELIAAALGAAIGAGDVLQAVDIRQVEVGGEIGRRVDVTIDNNLLGLTWTRTSSSRFARRRADGFIGLGMLIDSPARFSAYSGDAKAIERKKNLIDEALKTAGARRLPRACSAGRPDRKALGHSRAGLPRPRAACGTMSFRRGAVAGGGEKVADYMSRGVGRAGPQARRRRDQPSIMAVDRPGAGAAVALPRDRASGVISIRASNCGSCPNGDGRLPSGAGACRRPRLLPLSRCLAQLWLNDYRAEPG